MTDAQSNKLDMYLVVQDFYESNQAVIDTVTARATAFAQLTTNINAINAEIAGQSTNTTGVAQDKTALRNTLDNITAVTLASARSWAVVSGNNTLAAEFDYSTSDIQRIKDDTMQGFCTYRIGLINDNIASMLDYGIDATTITAWQDALNAYVAVLESPREAINSRHLHTQALKTLFSNTSELFKNQLDPLMMVFKIADPALYAGYKQARIVINRKGGSSDNGTPTNAVQISGNVKDGDTDMPISGATVQFITPDGTAPLVATTNDNGEYVIEATDVPQGVSVFGTMEVSAPNYGLVSEPIEVMAGNSYVRDFTLFAMPIP